MAKKRRLVHCLPAMAGSYVKARLRGKPARECELRAVFAADLHTDADPCRDRTDVLRRALAGIRHDGRTDVLALCGDITNCGDEKEYALLKRLQKAYLGDIRLLPQIGNHDSWHHSDDPDYPLAERLFQQFCRECGYETNKNYYGTEINGYPYIVTGTEVLCHNKPTLSLRQLEWVDRTLGEAVKTGRPVFVLSHQPPEGRTGVTPEQHEAGLGEASAETDALLMKHAKDADAPILFFSGHIHRLSPQWAEKACESLWYFNLPSLEYGDGGHGVCPPGTGATVTVSGNTLSVAVRDFIRGRDLPGYEIKLQWDDGIDKGEAET